MTYSDVERVLIVNNRLGRQSLQLIVTLTKSEHETNQTVARTSK